MTRHGEFNWNELQTKDAAAAVSFYSSCIGWSFKAEQMPSGGTYWIGSASGKPVCGILTLDQADAEHSDRWFTYVHVNDVDVQLEKVSGLGGSVLRVPWSVPGVGRIALIRDPGGADLGWVTPE